MKISAPNSSKQWIAQAEALLDQRNLPAAHTAFAQAEAFGADPNTCRAARWLIAMLDGNFEAAWRESDAIRSHGAADPHRFWNGEDLRGAQVIVRCLHGLGDTVQMLRYAPRLQQIARSVLFEVPPRFVPLASFFPGVDQVITWGEDSPPKPPVYDVQLELMELPYLFQTQPADLPIATHYLHLPEALVRQTASAMQATHRLRIGLVWAGGDWNPTRSIPFRLLRPLLEKRSLEFWNLQGGPACNEASAGMMHNATTTCGDGLLPLAATIANLDLLITADTLAAHIAGALGKPVWLMLQHAADWRWMTARNNSPWYPTIRLFRQAAPGDWPGVIDTIRKELQTFHPTPQSQ